MMRIWLRTDFMDFKSVVFSRPASLNKLDTMTETPFTPFNHNKNELEI